MKNMLAVFVLVSIFVGNAYAPDTKKIKVFVSVSAEDSITEGTITSYINRELRDLKDVVPINVQDIRDNPENNPDFGLLLVVLEPETVQGGKAGVTILSAVFIECIYAFDILPMDLPIVGKWDEVDPEKISLQQYIGLQGNLAGRQLRTKGTPIHYANFINNLVFYQPDTTKVSDSCKEIVANFDTEALEEAR